MSQPLRAVPASPASDIESFIPPFIRYLRSGGIVQGTIEKYCLAVRQLAEFVGPLAVAEVQKAQLREFMEHAVATWKSSTANSKFYSLQAFFAFLLEDEEIRWNPMEGMKPPPAPAPEVPIIPDEAINAMLKTCKSNSFEDRRDAALILMLLDTGGRVSELVNLTMDDVGDGAAHVMGKGAKPRSIFYGSTTARALDRYLRARDRHPWGRRSDRVWIGKRGPMTRFGIRDILERRCDEAGVDRVHPHQFRHTFAHEWLANGGHETDLMRLTGWSSRTMLSRYAASAADARAADSYKKRQSPADRLKGGGK